MPKLTEIFLYACTGCGKVSMMYNNKGLNAEIFCCICNESYTHVAICLYHNPKTVQFKANLEDVEEG